MTIYLIEASMVDTNSDYCDRLEVIEAEYYGYFTDKTEAEKFAKDLTDREWQQVFEDEVKRFTRINDRTRQEYEKATTIRNILIESGVGEHLAGAAPRRPSILPVPERETFRTEAATRYSVVEVKEHADAPSR